MPWGLDKKTLKLKWGNICARIRHNLTAVVWKDKGVMHILTVTNIPPAEGNFCHMHGKAQKCINIGDYS